MEPPPTPRKLGGASLPFSSLDTKRQEDFPGQQKGGAGGAWSPVPTSSRSAQDAPGGGDRRGLSSRGAVRLWIQGTGPGLHWVPAALSSVPEFGTDPL